MIHGPGGGAAAYGLASAPQLEFEDGRFPEEEASDIDQTDGLFGGTSVGPGDAGGGDGEGSGDME